MRHRSSGLGIVCLIAALATGPAASAQEAASPAGPDTAAASVGVSAADSTVQVSAGSTSGERWDLSRCIATALQKNGDVRGAAARTAQARGSALRAWSGVLPSISTNVSYSQIRPDKQSSFRGVLSDTLPDSTVQISSVYAPKNRYYSVGGSVDMNILSLPAYAEKRRQDLLQGSAEWGEAETRNTIVFDVKQRYFELLKAARLAQVSRDSEKLARDEEARSEALLQVGSVARGDLLKARARRAQTQLDRISAENQVKVARARLAQVMGLPPSTPLEVQELLDENVP
ncbi:MAG: TolC family protein, partial [Hyphomicrobiales bacterium]